MKRVEMGKLEQSITVLEGTDALCLCCLQSDDQGSRVHSEERVTNLAVSGARQLMGTSNGDWVVPGAAAITFDSIIAKQDCGPSVARSYFFQHRP